MASAGFHRPDDGAVVSAHFGGDAARLLEQQVAIANTQYGGIDRTLHLEYPRQHGDIVSKLALQLCEPDFRRRECDPAIPCSPLATSGFIQPGVGEHA